MIVVALTTVLVLAGCAATSGVGSGEAATPTSAPSPTRSSIASPAPTITQPPANPTPAPSTGEATAPDDGSDEQTTPPHQPSANEVDPAQFSSHATDAQNGGAPLPGVEFMTADGQIICGILMSGAVAGSPGTASCTPSTYREIIAQPVPEGPLFVKSMMVEPTGGSLYLHPDWFAQPARTIPVLPSGKSIHLEGTTCSIAGGAVTCIVEATGKGFTVSLVTQRIF